MAVLEQDLARARREVAERLAPLAGAARGVPALLVGDGPDLARHLEALAEAARERRCLVDGVPRVREWLRQRGWWPMELPLPPEMPPMVALHLSLRALGADPIVIVGADRCGDEGPVCGPADDRCLEWASELGPFRTIEDLHVASRRSGAARSEASIRDRELLERAIAEDLAKGLRTIDLAPVGDALAGAGRASVADALPARDEVEIPAERLAALRDGGARSAPLRARSGPLSIDLSPRRRVAAVVAIDPDVGGTGIPRHLDSEFGAGPVLAATLARLGMVRGIERIILLVPSGFDPRPLFDPGRVGLPVEIDACGASVFPPEQADIRAARLWSDTAWRGGIGGACIWDEIVAPAATLAALERRGLDGALCCGPDWPLVMVEELGGCDSLVERYRESEATLPMVACPGPPGLGACLLDRAFLERLARREGPVLVGDHWRRLVQPADDPGCVAPIDRIRRSMVRACFDSMRAKLRLRRAIEPIAVEQSTALGVAGIGAWAVVEALEHQFFHLPPAFSPQHLIIELNTGRRASGSASPHRLGGIQRLPMSERLLERILEEVEPPRDTVITFGHVGDPIWHPLLPRFVAMARQAGVRGVHVRTELLADAARVDAMLEAAPDAVSVDLHGLTAATYRSLMGINRFDRVLENLERLRAAKGPGDPRLRRPHLVVRLQRRAESAAEVLPFVEAWEPRVGTAVIEGIPRFAEDPESRPDPLVPCPPPPQSVMREAMRRMVILSDGRVPLGEIDLLGERSIGTVQQSGVAELWRDLMPRRRARGGDAESTVEWRWWQP